MPSRRVKELTKEEIGKLIKYFDDNGKQRDRIILEIMDQGARLSEVVALTPQDFDFDKGTVQLRYTKGDKPRTILIELRLADRIKTYIAYVNQYRKNEISKNTKKFNDDVKKWTDGLTAETVERRMPIDEARAYIHKGIMEHIRTQALSPLFGMKYKSIQQMIIRLPEKAGIDKAISPHTLRHTFAKHYLSDGGYPYLLQKQIGHANYNTTVDTYGHASIEDLERQFRELRG